VMGDGALQFFGLLARVFYNAEHSNYPQGSPHFEQQTTANYPQRSPHFEQRTTTYEKVLKIRGRQHARSQKYAEGSRKIVSLFHVLLWLLGNRKKIKSYFTSVSLYRSRNLIRFGKHDRTECQRTYRDRALDGWVILFFCLSTEGVNPCT
jgi:hypothetical protein